MNPPHRHFEDSLEEEARCGRRFHRLCGSESFTSSGRFVCTSRKPTSSQHCLGGQFGKLPPQNNTRKQTLLHKPLRPQDQNPEPFMDKGMLFNMGLGEDYQQAGKCYVKYRGAAAQPGEGSKQCRNRSASSSGIGVATARTPVPAVWTRVLQRHS